MTTKYKILFMVDLLNEYYRSLQCKDFTVIPSAETAELLKNSQMLCKTIGNKLIVLVKVGTEAPNEDKPFVTITPTNRFLFYLDLHQPVFTTVTNVDADKLRIKQRYYFTNLHENKAGIDLHLSRKIAAYNNAAAYKPGDLVDNGAGNIFECVQNTAGGNNTTDAAFWFPRSTEQFVSAADMLPFVTRTNRYQTTTPAKQFNIKVFGLNTVNNLYDREVKIAKSLATSDIATRDVPADLSELQPGRYKVQINTDSFDVFIDDTAVYRNFFSVIEVFSHLPATSDFSLLDAGGKVKDIVSGGSLQWLRYQVRFPNRLAFWKYITPRKGVKSITDKTNTYTFTQSPPLPAAPDYFQSDLPIPLYEAPAVYDLELNNPVSDEPPAAPNPDPTITGILSRTEPNKDYFCTMYLNY
jgi:hypothetical protein